MDEVDLISTLSTTSRLSDSNNFSVPDFKLASFHDVLISTLDAHRVLIPSRASSPTTRNASASEAASYILRRPYVPATSLSHIEYRKVLKKVKRKMKRRIQAVTVAKEEREKRRKAVDDDGTGEAGSEKEEEGAEGDENGYANDIAEQDDLDEIERKLREHEAWLVREKQAKREFEEKKSAEEDRRKEERRAEEELRKEAEEVEMRNLQVAAEAEKAKPPAPTDVNDPNNCEFYMRTGTCRYGKDCKRLHPEIEVGTKVLIPHMFNPPTLETVFSTPGGDVTLDDPNEDLLKAYREFYEDTLPEFRKIGTVRQFKVCSNRVKHLRGNVYVEYELEEEAFVAAQVFAGRWYAGKQLSAHVTVVRNWRGASCLQYLQNCCPKGKYCNYFHCFANPDGEFADADEESSVENVEIRRESTGGSSGSGVGERSSASWRKEGRLPPKWKRSPSPPGKHRPFRFRDHYVEDERIWKKGRNSREREKAEEKGVWSDDDDNEKKKRKQSSDSEEEVICDREKRRKREKRKRHRRSRSRSKSKDSEDGSSQSRSSSSSDDEMGKKILKATLKSMKSKKSKKNSKNKKKKKKKKSKKEKSRDPDDSTDSSWGSDASGD